MVSSMQPLNYYLQGLDKKSWEQIVFKENGVLSAQWYCSSTLDKINFDVFYWVENLSKPQQVNMLWFWSWNVHQSNGQSNGLMFKISAFLSLLEVNLNHQSCHQFATKENFMNSIFRKENQLHLSNAYSCRPIKKHSKMKLKTDSRKYRRR